MAFGLHGAVCARTFTSQPTVGVPREIKSQECRVGLIPGAVHELVAAGSSVVVESGAGSAIGLSDELYQKAGARIVETAAEVFAEADMIVKVKEPQPEECKMLREDQILFTYLHLAPDPLQTKLLQESACAPPCTQLALRVRSSPAPCALPSVQGSVCIAYETVTDDRGALPLLAPMSEVAGRMSIQAGAHCLEKTHGGLGVLLGGVPGTAPAKVTIIGGGVVGTSAARMAMGLEAMTTVLDKNLDRLRQLDMTYGRRLNTVYATLDSVESAVLESDLVVGAVLVPGAAAPRVVTRDHIKNMKPGAVLVDVAIDQGGCFETSKPTTHAEPTFTVDDVIHYW